VGEDRTNQSNATNRSLTVAEAAEALGISQEAVRMRIKRGTLRSERRDGRVFVLLGPYRPGDQTTDRPGEQGALISAKDDLIVTLREQLQAERQAHAEARRIIAGLVERIPPQLEAPPEARETTVPASEAPDRGAGRSQEEASESAQANPGRGFWARLFGR
jgi:excisionase family DNA binding protein